MLSWKSIREAQYYHREQRLARENPIDREMPLERYLSLREAEHLQQPVYEQTEFDAISDHESFVRHKEAMARRAFAWYRLCKDHEKKMKLIDTYNACALLGKKRDGR